MFSVISSLGVNVPSFNTLQYFSYVLIFILLLPKADLYVWKRRVNAFAPKIEILAPVLTVGRPPGTKFWNGETAVINSTNLLDKFISWSHTVQSPTIY